MKLEHPRLHDREQFVFERVKGRRVVSVGLGGQVGHTGYSFDLNSAELTNTFSARLAAHARHVSFVDVLDTALELFQKEVPGDYYLADITSDLAAWPAPLRAVQCDVVVVGEVLEHLADPGRALRNLQTLLAPGGAFVITVPNAFCLSVMARMLMRQEDVHPEHVAYYSVSTLTRLIELSGLSVTEVGFYRTRQFNASRLFRAPLGAISSAVAELLPQLGRGLVAVAEPGHRRS